MTQRQNSSILTEIQSVLFDDKDFLRSVVQQFLQQILQAEFDRYINAAPHERSEARNGHRNGSYPRTIKTRVGAIELQMCRDREGKFDTELFRRYQRSEQALVSSMVEMYLQGISTRKVKKVVEELCGSSISKSQISELAKGLDDQLTAWRNRPLTCRYPYLIIDARYEKIRTHQGVVSKAVLTVIGISEFGKREILAVEIGNSENEVMWAEVFKKLKERGLHGLVLIVSDDHKGLTKAVDRYWQGVLWQRCQVHFIRNFMKKMKYKDMDTYLKLLKDVFAATDKEEAMRRKNHLVELMADDYGEIADWLDAEIEFCFSVYALPESHRKRMKSTNMIERLNKELKRRSRVIGIFPDDNACIRVLGSLCQETSEEWETGRRYLDMNIEDAGGIAERQ